MSQVASGGQADLASIHSPEENAFVAGLVEDRPERGGEKDTWIAGTVEVSKTIRSFSCDFQSGSWRGVSLAGRDGLGLRELGPGRAGQEEPWPQAPRVCLHWQEHPGCGEVVGRSLPGEIQQNNLNLEILDDDF